MLGPQRRSALGRKQRFNLKHYRPAGWEFAPVLCLEPGLAQKPGGGPHYRELRELFHGRPYELRTRGTTSDRRWPVQRRSDAIGSAAVAEAQPRSTLGP